MIDEPDCPVCAADDWEVIGSRTYQRSACQAGDEYFRKRMRVLFEIWHVDEQQVTHESLLCCQCGFVIFRPRPSSEDLDRKYRFLSSLEPDENQQQVTPEREAHRAQRLWKLMRPYLESTPGGVLDFGGGDGRLVMPFADREYDCFVVDYHPAAVNGVTRLGATLDDLSSQERFDVIICSHVIEHVAEPFEILTRLRQHISDRGKFYVEVPMEIWKRPPLHAEPVTHVNFFTVKSLTTLLERAGITPLRVQMEDYPHPLGHQTVVVSAIGETNGASGGDFRRFGAEETRRLLNPGWTDRLRRALLRPEQVPGVFWNQLKRRVVR